MKKKRMLLITMAVSISLLSVLYASESKAKSVSVDIKSALNEEKDELKINGDGIIPIDYKRGKLSSIEEAEKRGRRYDFKSYDLSSIDLSNESEAIFNSTFDSKTKWSNKMPKGVNIDTILEYGKNPGLGIEKLHSEGINGEGINIGVVDTRLLVTHDELKDRLKMYEEVKRMDGEVHYHGTPITSIIAGKNEGIAPKANIYYVAYKPCVDNAGKFDEKVLDESYAQLGKAIDRLVEVSKTLPKDKKIRVISVSSGWADEDIPKCQGIYNALKKAKDEGIFVVTARLYETHGLYFYGLGRNPLKNPEDIASYDPAKHVLDIKEYENAKEILLVPMDSRCLAGPTGNKDYVFYSNGAWSMAIPYISGLYALACQVKPDITPDLFWKQALATADPVDKNIYKNEERYGRDAIKGKIVNPVKLIDTLKKMK